MITTITTDNGLWRIHDGEERSDGRKEILKNGRSYPSLQSIQVFLKNGPIPASSFPHDTLQIPENTHFLMGSITVRLTSCLTGLDSTKLVNLYLIQHKQSSWILTGQTVGQPYSDTSPFKVSECFLAKWPGVKCPESTAKIVFAITSAVIITEKVLIKILLPHQCDQKKIAKCL